MNQPIKPEPVAPRGVLVLTRRPGQIVDLTDEQGNQTELSVIAVNGDRVRLAFRARPGVKIFRREVSERIATEGQTKPAA